MVVCYITLILIHYYGDSEWYLQPVKWHGVYMDKVSGVLQNGDFVKRYNRQYIHLVSVWIRTSVMLKSKCVALV